MLRLPLALALLFTSLAWGRASSPPAGIVPPNAPKSTFVYSQHEAGFGKDPFFPLTGRFKDAAPVDPGIKPVSADFLSLKGISISGGRKLAIINNYTFAEGEEVSLRYNNQVAKVKCIEIKDRLVLIQVNGTPKELALPSRLQ